MKPGASALGLSVVVPVYNESASIAQLLHEIRTALDAFGRSYEIILVDDGSDDDSWELIRRSRIEHPRLRALKLAARSGQTAALMAGIRASRGDIVVTLDGDLQNDPADIPKLVLKLEDGYEIVSGWRRQRQDKLLSRRLPSVLANALVRKLAGITIRDNGCALKAYRGSVLRSISLYSDFHRFIVPLAQMGGARVAEIETHHRSRKFGRSKYGLTRTFKVMADLATLVLILRFSHRLLIWFLLFAVPPFLLALAVTFGLAREVLFPTEAGLTVYVGSCVLLYQAVFAIVAYGLFAERMRQLAPNRPGKGTRILVTLAEARTGDLARLLVQDLRVLPLSGTPARGRPSRS